MLCTTFFSNLFSRAWTKPILKLCLAINKSLCLWTFSVHRHFTELNASKNWFCLSCGIFLVPLPPSKERFNSCRRQLIIKSSLKCACSVFFCWFETLIKASFPLSFFQPEKYSSKRKTVCLQSLVLCDLGDAFKESFYRFSG